MPNIWRVYEPPKSVSLKLLRIVLLLIFWLCLGLLIAYDYHTFTYEQNMIRFCFTTLGAYIIIFGVDFIALLLHSEMPTMLMLIFMTVGTFLFTLCGTFGFLIISEAIDKNSNLSLLLFSIFSIIAACLMAINILITIIYESKQYPFRHDEYRFNPVKVNVEQGNVILHLINPQSIAATSQQERLNVNRLQQQREPIGHILKSGGASGQRMEMTTRDVRVSDLDLKEAEVTPLKGKFYLVKKGLKDEVTLVKIKSNTGLNNSFHTINSLSELKEVDRKKDRQDPS
uniref:Uncharacterized protein n=1 Tax=Clastoptera arizonana TaxID=38151 RepID=A0A1B6DL20_9HEMI